MGVSISVALSPIRDVQIPALRQRGEAGWTECWQNETGGCGETESGSRLLRAEIRQE
jgi:hypothetical protein